MLIDTRQDLPSGKAKSSGTTAPEKEEEHRRKALSPSDSDPTWRPGSQNFKNFSRILLGQYFPRIIIFLIENSCCRTVIPA